MNLPRLALSGLLAAALQLGWLAPVALAQSAPAKAAAAATKLSLSADPRMDSRGRPVKGQLVLNATLTTTDGKPINHQAINFYQQVDILGPHDAFVGTATTDATGVASLLYEPAQSGDQGLRARYPGTAELASQTAEASTTIRDTLPPFKGEPVPLGAVATGLSIGAGLLVLGVWLVLLGVLLRTVLGIRASAGTAAGNS